MIIVVSNQKGGVGKSTIALNIAVYMQEYKNVTLIDLDIQRTLSFANEMRKTHGKELDVIAIHSEREFKKLIKQDNDEKLLLIDSGGFDSELNRLAIKSADLVITPASDKTFDLMALKRYEMVLEQLSKSARKHITSYVVLNNISPMTKKFDEVNEFITDSENFKLFNSVLRQRADLAKSSGQGLSVCEFSKKSKANNEMALFNDEIMELLNIPTNYTA